MSKNNLAEQYDHYSFRMVDRLVDKHKDVFAGTQFCGVAITEMSSEQLRAIVCYQAERATDIRAEHKRQRKFMADMRSGKVG